MNKPSHSWTMSLGALVVGLSAAFAIPTTAQRSASAEAPQVLEENRWRFTFRIENRTGREIHVKAMEGKEPLFEETMAAHPPTEGVAELLPGGPFPTRKDATAFIKEDAESIEIEETLALRTKRTFKIRGFTKTPELDFSLAVTNDGMNLKQDQELGLERLKDIPLAEQEKYLEGMRFGRRQLDQRALWIVNTTGREVHVKAYVDGRLAFEGRVPGENPPGWVPAADAVPPYYPRLRAVLVLSPLAKELVVEEDLVANKRNAIALGSFLRGAGSIALTVYEDRLRVRTGHFAFR